MATRKGIIKMSRGDLVILAAFVTARLEATPIAVAIETLSHSPTDWQSEK